VTWLALPRISSTSGSSFMSTFWAQVQSLRFSVWGSEVGVQSVGFRGWGSECGVQGVRFRVWGSEVGVQSVRFRV
jgi:hypothetical protein